MKKTFSIINIYTKMWLLEVIGPKPATSLFKAKNNYWYDVI